MQPKPVLCSCGKRFGNDDSKLQHQRDSSRHIAAPQTPVRIPRLDQLMGSLMLRDQEADSGFIPFIGGGPTTVLALNPGLSIAAQVMAGGKVSFIAEGTKTSKTSKTQKKKTRRGCPRNNVQGGYSSTKFNPNTGQMMNMFEDQNWALCDKDCGWCGHCTEGAYY